ncbi:hypothetical protein KPP03845_106406 [Streptomyces xanthophaeus]|nr:hypothetical protein KPP03845_106406 [Streptomyces xanthophaeus]
MTPAPEPRKGAGTGVMLRDRDQAGRPPKGAPVP